MQDISTRHIKKCLLRHIRLIPRHISKTYTGDIFVPRHIHKTYTLFVRHIHMVSWEYVLQTLNMSWIPLNMSSRCRLRYMSPEYVLKICLVTRLYMSCVYVFCAQDIYKYVLGDEYVLRYVCQDIFVDTYMSCEYVLCQTRVCRCNTPKNEGDFFRPPGVDFETVQWDYRIFTPGIVSTNRWTVTQ